MIDPQGATGSGGPPSDRVCSRCGRTFRVGPILHPEGDSPSRPGKSARCDACLSRRGIGGMVGGFFELLDFGYWYFVIAAVILSMIFGLLARGPAGK